MKIKISDRWFITCDRLQYILNEVIVNTSPRAKNKTRIIQTYYTNLGTLLEHVAEYEPRAIETKGIQDLIKAFKTTQETLKRATEILVSNGVAYRIRDANLTSQDIG